ncbi:phosphatase PAP2 family protein [Aequorivita soesokkakensis]|uniref:phosphatase PAP2 family protein n=1 Tax=Aequorivita soesokkakensis TaxID=1385699 RepID=UPI000B9C4501|nr:phosphatase PAP2 family protein [Aequorivita soesokkakensis]
MKKTISLLAILFAIHTYAQDSLNVTKINYNFNTGLTASQDTIPQDNNYSSLSNQSKNTSTNSPSTSFSGNIQNKSVDKSTSPYEWKWVRDGIWTGVGIGASAYGLILIKNKDDLPLAERDKFLDPVKLQEEIDNLPFLDKWVAGNHSENANSISDIPFALSFAAPFAFLFDAEINDHTGQYIGLYIESLATTAAIYTITAGLVDRSRPYVYDNSGDTTDDRRFKNNGQRSFYSGHVAATATATFFAAKAYSDFNPDANGKVFIWGGAAVLPAAVGVFRMEAGQHFLTDVLLGYVLGAGTGILVPELHKRKNENIDIYPSSGTSFNGDSYNGMAFRYTF